MGKLLLVTCLLAGAMAGLAGMVEVAAVQRLLRVVEEGAECRRQREQKLRPRHARVGHE